jgi:CRP-like cAMP-binding protein
MATVKFASQATSPNQILARLATRDFELLEPHLMSVELRVPQQLESPNKRIAFVYFIESGFASVLANERRQATEVGLIGREGMTGLAVIMGRDRSPCETYMQGAGTGQRITAEHLRTAIGRSASLHQVLLQYAHSFYMETTQTAVSNMRGSVKQRLARWLLMAHDRVEDDELYLTHEFLALMIGVRRASITDTLRSLAEDDLIAAKRGAISIINRVKLQKTAKNYTPISKAF